MKGMLAADRKSGQKTSHLRSIRRTIDCARQGTDQPVARGSWIEDVHEEAFKQNGRRLIGGL
jgi:hypothetical protein